MYCSLFAALLATAWADSSRFDPASYSSSNVIKRDFAIIGGGATGTYAAISLKDLSKSFAVVEKTNKLGGHTHSYQDPDSGKYVNYGVQLYYNSSVVRDFFTRLNASYTNLERTQLGDPTIYADLEAKELMPNYSAGSAGQDYLDVLDEYAPAVDDLSYLETPVDSDLLLKWPDYIRKHNISYLSAVASFNRPAAPGTLLDDITLYTLNQFNHINQHDYTLGGSIVNADRDNSQMYRNAQEELGDSVLYQSTVIAASRGEDEVRLVVQTSDGIKLIIAKQLIIAMPQTVDNMKYFDLDAEETALISKIRGGFYYGGAVNNTGLNETAAYYNRGINTPWNVTKLPGILSFLPSPADSFHFYWYTSDEASSRQQVEEAAARAIETLQGLQNLTRTKPGFADYWDFSPIKLTVPAEDIQEGFYEKFKSLQGYRNTWYTGAFFTVSSGQLFNSTKNLLPEIVGACT